MLIATRLEHQVLARHDDAPQDDRHAFIRMEFKRFLDTVIRMPAMVIVRARTIVIRLVAYTVSLDRFFSAWATTERTRFG